MCFWHDQATLLDEALSYRALAQGAGGILFFQWRTSRYGIETLLPGLVSPGCTANSRSWQELFELGAELRQLAGLIRSESRKRVAIIVSWPNRWALEQAGKPPTFDATAECLASYKTLSQRSIGLGRVSPRAELSGYEVVVAPCLSPMTPNVADGLRAYVEDGD